jgi:hypothetical protein
LFFRREGVMTETESSPMITVGKILIKIGHGLVITGALIGILLYGPTDGWSLAYLMGFVALALIFYFVGAVVENIWYRND